MTHHHTCRDCGAAIGLGGDGCELDQDHDFALCAPCALREAEAGAPARGFAGGYRP